MKNEEWRMKNGLQRLHQLHGYNVTWLQSGFFGGGVEDVDLAEAGDRTAVAHGVGLSRFAFAVVGVAIQFVSGGAAEVVTGIPEIGGARLISNIAQHFADFPFLDLPKGLAAELEVVTLL